MKKLIIISLMALVCQISIFPQESQVDVNHEGKAFTSLKHAWTAQWVTHPTESTLDYGVFHFRNRFELESVPSRFIIHVSADNRYRLYVNGQFVCAGPAIGDINHYRYETIDIAEFLNQGENVIAAEVVNFGEYRRAAQQTFQTAFIIQGDEATGAGPEINTGTGKWKVMRNSAYTQIPFTSDSLKAYYSAGPGESIDAAKYPWGWKSLDFNDSTWLDPKAGTVEFAVGRGFLYGSTWFLVPRQIPMLKEVPERFSKIVRVENLDHLEPFIRESVSATIPAHTKATILLDNSVHTIGFPELIISKGEGALIKITYAEALFRDNKNHPTSTADHFDPGDRKGDRNIIEGKEIMGYYDRITADGGSMRKYKPLSLKTFRYVQFDIETREEALVIDDFYNVNTTYPFEEKASFNSDHPQLNQIWEAAWRTIENSSGENFFDPYYEQLNYIGDARIEAIVSIYVSGDDRLMRKSIQQFDDSRLPNGLTQSRYPSYIVQVIPTYSLLWIGMIHDYLMYRDDPEFTRQFLPGIKTVLAWFEERIDSTGMVTDLEWWNFTDWADGFANGIPPGADNGYSANVALQYVYALQNAKDIFNYFGLTEEAEQCDNLNASIQQATMKRCFDAASGLIAETPEKQVYSQHTNIWAILTNTVAEEDQPELMEKILAEEHLIQSTIYFKFYLFRALQKAGMGNEYLELLAPWEGMLDKGMTTFGERDINPRSECHGWSASPCFDLLHTVAGITPGSPGFENVVIQPNPGKLQEMEVDFPHPKGNIHLSLQREGKKGIVGEIILPAELKGTFLWEGIPMELKEGRNKIDVNQAP
ncbi:MAG: alpha-L-rhamnosidase N-terminal domain-containing protein [Bacteroidota bacterium]